MFLFKVGKFSLLPFKRKSEEEEKERKKKNLSGKLKILIALPERNSMEENLIYEMGNLLK